MAGVIAGAICAVAAAIFELGVVAFRFFSIGRMGDHLGGGIVVLALTGALLGGVVAAGVSAVFARTGAPSQAG